MSYFHSAMGTLAKAADKLLSGQPLTAEDVTDIRRQLTDTVDLVIADYDKICQQIDQSIESLRAPLMQHLTNAANVVLARAKELLTMLVAAYKCVKQILC